MKRPHRNLLLAEIFLCGAAPTLLLVIYVPWAFLIPFVSAVKNLGFISLCVLLALLGMVAMTQYWHLAIQTLKDEPFNFGKAFLFGLASTVASLLMLAIWLPRFGLAVLPTVFSALHFSLLQKRRIANDLV